MAHAKMKASFFQSNTALWTNSKSLTTQ